MYPYVGIDSNPDLWRYRCSSLSNSPGFLVIFLYLVLVFFVLNSLLEITRQWSLEKFAILTLKHRSHVRMLIYRTWAIELASGSL